MKRVLRSIPIWMALATVWLALLPYTPAHGQAYCYVREVASDQLLNGVQIRVKADGILRWNWDTNVDVEKEVSSIAVRFPDARIGTDKTLYDVDREPVSAATLAVPQDSEDGRGVVLTVNMTEPSRVDASLSEDRQVFLLTVHSSRTIERIARTTTAAQVKTGTFEVKAYAGLVSVRAVKSNIHQVISEVARQGNISVAVDDAVRHDVSVNVQNKPALEVIRGICAAYGLALSSVGDVYMISEGVPADLSTYRRSGTTSFPMKYLKASDARSLLPTFLFKYVHDNPEQNAVVVTAPTQMLGKIGRDLQATDVPPPMIMIECAVVELTDSADFDFQFNAAYESPEHAVSVNTGTGRVGYTQLDTSNGLATAIAPTAKLQATLQALVTKGKAEVRAHPSMAAVNGKDAEIFIGSQRFIKMQSYRNGTLQERIETIPVGVKLGVRPWTGGDKEITTWLNVEVSNIVEVDPQTGVPRLGTRQASTTLRTLDGDTIVIGGLSQRQDERTRRRIPFLSSLPLIGQLFRSKADRMTDRELVILVRPRLLDDSGRLPAAEDSLTRQRFLLPGDLGYQEEPGK